MKKLLANDDNVDDRNGRCRRRLRFKRSHYRSLGVVGAAWWHGWLGEAAAEPEWPIAVPAIVVASGTDFFFCPSTTVTEVLL